MVETQVGFLIKAADSLTMIEYNNSQNLLKSYYLMRCRELTKGFGLPEKYFSSKVRCPRCLINWKNGMDVKIQTIKISTKQRRRIRKLKLKNNNKEYVENKKQLLNSNNIKQICKFCKNSIATLSQKPSKSQVKELDSVTSRKPQDTIKNESSLAKVKDKSQQKVSNSDTNNKKHVMKTAAVNVYSRSKDAFSILDKNNTLQGVAKKEKNIKNNKRKKDKFAGLCKQAVLASAKLKEEKKKENKLNLFLKPST